MLRSELRSLVWNWLDDNTGGYFTESLVNQWLNDAQLEVQKRLIKAGQNYYMRCVQTTLVYGQRDYILPEDILKIHRLDIITSGTVPNEICYPVIPIIMSQTDFIPTGVGTAGVYFFKGNKITLYPAPQTPYTMRLYYSPQVADMTLDTDEPQVPPRYQELIALLAAQDGYIKDGRAAELLVKKIAEYQAQLDSDAQERNIDYPRSVNETEFNTYDCGVLW